MRRLCPHTLTLYLLRAAVLLALASLVPPPARAANPFAERPEGAAKPPRSAISPVSTAPLGSSMPAPGLADVRMPPGTPSQVVGGQGDANQRAAAQRDVLENLGISSVAGTRILFRVARQQTASFSANGGASLAGLSGTGAGAPAGGSAALSMQSFSLVRAQDRKPFLLGSEAFVAVVDGFTVTLYRAADREMRTPVWTGEPGPTPSLTLSPNVAEFVPQPAPPAAPNAVPPAVMPSTAFGAGQATGGGLGSNPTTGSAPGTGAGTPR